MNTKLDPPKIPDDLDLLSESIQFIESKAEISRGMIENAAIEYQAATRVSFDKVIFKNVTFFESSFPEIELTDVIFEKCDVSNIDFSGAFMRRVEFRACKMLGTDFSNSKIQHTLFEGCIGDYSLFRFAEFKQVTFNNCSLISSDYYQSKKQLSLNFNGCNINKAILSGLKLKGIDLSDCDFEEILVEVADLEGCTIAPHHASALVGLLGVHIK